MGKSAKKELLADLISVLSVSFHLYIRCNFAR